MAVVMKEDPLYERLLSDDKVIDKPPGWGLQARHTLALLSSIGFFGMYCLRSSLNVAMVAMVNSSSSLPDNPNGECPIAVSALDNSTTADYAVQGQFNWDERTQGIILGGFFYGYSVSQLPGGWLAEKVGGKRLMGFGYLCSSLLTFTIPTAARAGPLYITAVRLLQGVAEGGNSPALLVLWAEWAPIHERSQLTSISYIGSELGVVCALLVTGFLCQYESIGGWPSAFYLFGTVGCLWFVLWTFLVYDSPAEHPRISRAEKLYIEKSRGQRQHFPAPWRQIALSPAVWALCFAQFASSWGYYTMMTCLPTFLSNILHFDLTADGVLSGMPYVVLSVLSMVTSIIADCIVKRRLLTTGSARKLMFTIGSLMSACFLLAGVHVGCNAGLTVALVTVGIAGKGFAGPAYNVNLLDIAPTFAGTLAGVSYTFGSIPGFLGPALLGILTNHNQTMAQWRVFFYITAAIYLAAIIVFNLLGKGEVQPWAKVSPAVCPTPYENTTSDSEDSDSEQ